MADPISRETVNEVCALLNQAPPEASEMVVAQLRQEQPAIHEYLVGLARPPFAFNQREHDRICSIGVVLWQIMKHSSRPLGQVARQTLDRIEQKRNLEIEQLARMRPQDRQGRIALQVTGYPEPEVLVCLVASLKKDPDSPFDEESQLFALQALRILLDALIASLAPEPGQRPRPRTRRGN